MRKTATTGHTPLAGINEASMSRASVTRSFQPRSRRGIAAVAVVVLGGALAACGSSASDNPSTPSQGTTTTMDPGMDHGASTTMDPGMDHGATSGT